MRAHECYHCKQWVEEGEAHDCWTTTEEALTDDLSEELREAWQRIREAAVELGEQRIYASHSSIMFSRTSCHFFVRPKRTYLELCIFLTRALVSPMVRKAMPSSKTKFANLVRITHRDEVEPPVTEWMREAWELTDPDRPKAAATAVPSRTRRSRRSRSARSLKKSSGASRPAARKSRRASKKKRSS
jgi:hypothetical protein